ncbi:MAG TPA: MaoC/PaaZ C-terminal domain-containing protein [Trebonia sp.]
MADQTYFEDVNVGDAIPTLAVTVDETQMFFFSAATYNGHRIHYDKTWATEVEGYPNILVHGPLQAALLARAVTDWAGPDGRLVSYAIQNRASAFPGEELRFVGTVTGKCDEGADSGSTADHGAADHGAADHGRGLVDLEIRGEKGEAQVLMPGTATVSLPKRG